MRILITGGTGMLGRALIQRCREAGDSIHYLSRRPDGISNAPGLRGFLWDPAKASMDPAALDGVTAIVNLAGDSINQPWTNANKKSIRQSRIDSLHTLQKALAKHRHEVGYLVSASAIGYYPSSQTAYFTEEMPAGTGFLADTVRDWEEEAANFRNLGIATCCLRIGLVLDSRSGALPAMARPIRWYAGAPLGNGTQWQSWIHRDDVVSVFRFALEQRLEGVYNAVAPNPVTNSKLIREIAGILGKPTWLPGIPASLLKLLLGERSELVLSSQRVSPEKIRMEGFTFDYCNLRPALEDLLT